MSKFSALIDYLQYKFASKDAHGIHSPFVFYLYNAVVSEDAEYYDYSLLSSIREELKQNEQVLTIKDFGAGSRVFKGNQRRIKDICKYGISEEKYARLLFRLVNYFSPKTTVELGTSIGLTTMYLALAAKKSMVHTLEGSDAIADFARALFDKNQVANIELINGTFDEALPPLLNRLEKVDFAYIDGNHSKKPTLDYFELLLNKCHNDSVIVFDDINWSKEMKESWSEVKNHPRVSLTIDLFFVGIVFFRKENKMKEHFVLKF